jgi:hypothetical protein
MSTGPAPRHGPDSIGGRLAFLTSGGGELAAQQAFGLLLGKHQPFTQARAGERMQ